MLVLFKHMSLNYGQAMPHSDVAWCPLISIGIQKYVPQKSAYNIFSMCILCKNENEIVYKCLEKQCIE